MVKLLSRICLFMALLVCFAPVARAGRAELVDPGYEKIAMADGTAPGAAVVKAAILDAARRRHWEVMSTEPGKAVLAIRPRVHVAVVAARYDDNGFKLEYVSSENLDYEVKQGKPYIHGNYNVWVDNLADQIRASRVFSPEEEVVPDAVAIDETMASAPADNAPDAIASNEPIAVSDGPIKTSKVVPYRAALPADSGYAQCNWNRELSAHIVEYSKGRVVATDEDLETLPGRTLRVQILTTHAAGGGGFSGPKWGAIRADLYEGNKLLGRFDRHRRTIGAFSSSCGSLSKIADALGADVAAWLRRGVFSVPVEADATPIEIGPPETVPPIEH